MKTRVLAVMGIALALSLGGCSNAAHGAHIVNSVDVKATDTTCQLGKTTLMPGRSTFHVTNKGSQVTEVYVYAEQDGTYDRIVGEVENIGPGLRRDLTVIVPHGTYEVACKPGMKGDGIRSHIEVE